jgi:hypothetical protein
MSSVTINLTETDCQKIRDLLCQEGESIQQTITRIIKAEIKNKELQKALRY